MIYLFLGIEMLFAVFCIDIFFLGYVDTDDFKLSLIAAIGVFVIFNMIMFGLVFIYIGSRILNKG